MPLETTNGRSGFFKSGDWYLLGVQTLSALCLACWGICSTLVLLYIINILIPIRMDPNEELVGADLMEHRIRHSKIGISRAISALSPLRVNLDEIADVPPIGMNPGHEGIVDELQAVTIDFAHFPIRLSIESWISFVICFAGQSQNEALE